MPTANYLTADDIKRFLVTTLTVMLRQMREVSDDPGDPETGRMSVAESIGAMEELIRQMREVRASDTRMIQLSEMVPTVDMMADMIPATGMLAMGPDVAVFLDSMVNAARAYTGRGSDRLR